MMDWGLEEGRHTSGWPSGQRNDSGSNAEAGVFSDGCLSGLAEYSVKGMPLWMPLGIETGAMACNFA